MTWPFSGTCWVFGRKGVCGGERWGIGRPCDPNHRLGNGVLKLLGVDGRTINAGPEMGLGDAYRPGLVVLDHHVHRLALFRSFLWYWPLDIEIDDGPGVQA